MSYLSTTLRLCVLISCAIAYKHPPLTDDNNPLDKPNNPPFGISYKWEWQSQDTSDDGTIMSPRFRREIIDKKHIKGNVKPDEKILPKVKSTKPPMKDPPDTTSYILKAKSIPLLKKDERAPLTDLEQTTKGVGQTLDEDETTPLTDLEHTTKGAGQTLDEDETTPLTDLEHTTKASGQTLDEDETTPLNDLEHTTKGAGQTLDEDETTPLTDLEHTTKGAGQTLDEDETTPLTDLEHTTKASGQTLSEDETTKGGVKAVEKIQPKVNPTEPPLEEFSDTTPYLLETSSATLKKALSLSNEDETTILTDLKQTTKGAGQTLDEDETTHVEKSVTQSKTLVTELTLRSTTSKKQVDSTTNQQTSTNDKLLEDITSSLSLKAAETSPTLSPVTSRDQTTGHDVTTGWFLASSGHSSKPEAVTRTTTSSEDKVHVQSMMRQCMIAILILAIICTIFIIATIALAAKLSTMRQNNKLRLPVTYTEMRCISSLMPDGDQRNKPQDKRLKTFAATLEESDGDNTTLHSFLPDH